MSPHSQSRPRYFLRLARFARDKKGVATIEFAFLIPLLMLMAFGTFEIGRAVIVHKRLQRATDMVADLVAREEKLGTTVQEAKDELAGIMRAAEHSMFPYATAPLKMGVMSVRASIALPVTTTVEWSYKYHNKTGVPLCPAPKTMPQTGMIQPGNAVIMVESEYLYTPLLTNIIPGLVGPMTIKDSMIYAPRNACVDVAGHNCAGGCAPSLN